MTQKENKIIDQFIIKFCFVVFVLIIDIYVCFFMVHAQHQLIKVWVIPFLKDSGILQQQQQSRYSRYMHAYKNIHALGRHKFMTVIQTIIHVHNNYYTKNKFILVLCHKFNKQQLSRYFSQYVSIILLWLSGIIFLSYFFAQPYLGVYSQHDFSGSLMGTSNECFLRIYIYICIFVIDNQIYITHTLMMITFFLFYLLRSTNK
eukprot:TRINITY_DN5804_c0_g2_i2.p1 TRINITY_DN5804_c0_g2~~TRINITY_DN5804_c0_g2_i2.p1  ORF type:complete len:203 (+),score=-29.73 TRINITY_DN5804_c0_g2_i2:377-985(+)